MTIKAVLVILWSMLTMSNADHGIYISVFEIEHNVTEEEGTITIKSFSDDLANALRSMNFNIPEDDDPCGQEDALMAYIDIHFKILMNGKDVQLKINSCTRQNDTHWVELSYSFDQDLEKLVISTDWLTELFFNQQNIIKVKNGMIRKHTRLSKEQIESTMEF